jgi:hypothetical protein
MAAMRALELDHAMSSIDHMHPLNRRAARQVVVSEKHRSSSNLTFGMAARAGLLTGVSGQLAKVDARMGARLGDGGGELDSGLTAKSVKRHSSRRAKPSLADLFGNGAHGHPIPLTGLDLATCPKGSRVHLSSSIWSAWCG